MQEVVIRTCLHNYEKPAQEGVLDGTDVHC